MALLGEAQEISMDGFQVVSASMFSNCYQRHDLPTITMWNSHISFSKAAVNALNNCDRVRIEVNSEKRGVLLIPVTSKDKDGIRWMKAGKEPQGRRLECRPFMEMLYRNWGWNKKNVYRSHGRIVVCDQKIMLFFDFSSPDNWEFRTKTKAKEA